MVALFTALQDLKRQHPAHYDGDSIATNLFRRAWHELLEGEDATQVADEISALAIAQILFPGCDEGFWPAAEIAESEAVRLMQAAVRESAGDFVHPVQLEELYEGIGRWGRVRLALPARPTAPSAPTEERTRRASQTRSIAPSAPTEERTRRASQTRPALDLLCRQPRAGATRPGYQRLVLVPAELHSEHCLLTAVYAYLSAEGYGADRGVAFLAGLAHHLHNALLPDCGFAGEILLGEHLAGVIATGRARALAQLPEALAEHTRAALRFHETIDTPEGRAISAGDVLDRVLDVKWRTRAAAVLDARHPRRFGPRARRPAKGISDRPSRQNRIMDGELAFGDFNFGDKGGMDTSHHVEMPGGYALIGPHYYDHYDEGLRVSSPNILTDGRDEYPVVDGIPYLIVESTRPGLEGLRERACAALRAGDEEAALRLLLRDQDRFSPTEPPSQTAIDELLRRRDEITLREAMALLNYGAVADYFAHRWSSPTFQSGLSLLERAALPSRPVLEVACGIGHFLRHMEGQGYAAVGVDIVWSKLWLARHFLGVKGPLVCADIERSPVLYPGWSAEQASLPHTVLCHDAFYFFEDKRRAWTNLMMASNRGTTICGHVHTRGDRHEAGFAERLQDYRQYVPKHIDLLDDHSQAYTYVSRESRNPLATERSTAAAWVEGRKLRNVRDLRPSREQLRVNPLLTADGEIDWPSDGWREEFEADSEASACAGLEAFAKTQHVRALVASGRAGDRHVDREANCPSVTDTVCY